VPRTAWDRSSSSPAGADRRGQASRSEPFRSLQQRCQQRASEPRSAVSRDCASSKVSKNVSRTDGLPWDLGLVQHLHDPVAVRRVKHVVVGAAKSRGEVVQDKADAGKMERFQLGIGPDRLRIQGSKPRPYSQALRRIIVKYQRLALSPFIGLTRLSGTRLSDNGP
jgi:hypothetical protein